jgi:4'-phosphopantetheinyl transferase
MKPARTPTIEPDEVHLWVASLEVPPEEPASLVALLSQDERSRARRLRRARDRALFIAARATVRRVLGAYLELPPGDLRFTYGEMGQPRLHERHVEDLHFNLSHSRHLLLLGVSHGRAVGVDLEPLRSLPHRPAIERRLFSESERRMLAQLPVEQRTEAFFNGWTRKEAFAKATGEGMWATMRRIEVALAPGEEAELLTLDGSREAAAGWTLFHLEPASGFVGAAAVEGPPGSISIRDLMHEEEAIR